LQFYKLVLVGSVSKLVMEQLKIVNCPINKEKSKNKIKKEDNIVLLFILDMVLKQTK